MPTVAVIRTGIVPILNAVVNQLVTLGVTTTAHVKIVARSQQDVSMTMGDYDILLRPRGATRTGNIGGGRIDRRVVRRLAVTLRTRLTLDEVSRDTDWLDDPTLGHFVKEEAIVDALDTFQPDDVGDGSGNLLAFEPLWFIGVSEPDKDRVDPSWGISVIEFDVPYLMSLNQSRQ